MRARENFSQGNHRGRSDCGNERWIALWQRLCAQRSTSVVYNDLVARYSEPYRAHHTLQHIEHCLDELEQVRDLTTNPDAVELAL